MLIFGFIIHLDYEDLKAQELNERKFLKNDPHSTLKFQPAINHAKIKNLMVKSKKMSTDSK